MWCGAPENMNNSVFVVPIITRPKNGQRLNKTFRMLFFATDCLCSDRVWTNRISVLLHHDRASRNFFSCFGTSDLTSIRTVVFFLVGCEYKESSSTVHLRYNIIICMHSSFAYSVLHTKKPFIYTHIIIQFNKTEFPFVHSFTVFWFVFHTVRLFGF